MPPTEHPMAGVCLTERAPAHTCVIKENSLFSGYLVNVDVACQIMLLYRHVRYIFKHATYLLVEKIDGVLLNGILLYIIYCLNAPIQ